ncbi:hypothetical protein L204_102370 [Cryptococcus depauperatus]
MLAKAAIPTLVLAVIGFLFFIFVTFSVPYIKSIYLLRVAGTVGISVVSASAYAKAGVFGMCYEGESAKILGIQIFHGEEDCSSPKLGYDFDDTLVGLFTSENTRAIVKSFSTALVLNPIAAAFGGMGVITGLLAWVFASRGYGIATFTALLVAALVGWLAFILNLVLALVGRHRIHDVTNGLATGHPGSAIWLSLIGAILFSLATCAAGFGVFGRYRSDLPPSIEKEGTQPRWRKNIFRGTY